MTSDHSLPEEEDAAPAPPGGIPFSPSHKSQTKEPTELHGREALPRPGGPGVKVSLGSEHRSGSLAHPWSSLWVCKQAASFLFHEVTAWELPQGLGWTCRDSWRRDGAASRKLHGRFWAPPMLHSRPFLQGRCPLGCSSDCGERWDRAGLISLPLVYSGAPQKLGGEWLGPQSTGWGSLDVGWGGAGGTAPRVHGCQSPRVTGSADVDTVEVVGAKG